MSIATPSRLHATGLRLDGAALGVLLLAVLVAHATVFGGAFQFDDFNVVVREASVQSVSAWLRSQPGIRPLLKLTYALNHESGAGLAGFHAVNVALHALNTWLVWRLASLLAPATGVDAPRRLAFFVAAVFALHPVQTEAVVYVCGRSTSLAASFALASIVWWLQGRERGDGRAMRLLSPLALAAALACKEYAAVTPLALLLCACLRDPGPFAWGAWWRDTRVHVAVTALALAAALAVPRYRMLLDTSLALRGLSSNLLTQAQALTWLAGQLVQLDALNADPALPVIVAADAPRAALAGVWLVLLAAALWAWRRHRVAAFSVLWFLLWLAPTQSLLPRLDVANDRQLYVALIGPAFGIGCLLMRTCARDAVALAIPAVMLVLGTATWQRNRVYADEVHYWADVAAKAPHNARAYANLGHALALQGRRPQAEAALGVALALDPALHQAAVNLQLLRAGTGPTRP